MSDTPRTDEAMWPSSTVVLAEFARTLERELAACRADRDGWKIMAERYEELLKDHSRLASREGSEDVDCSRSSEIGTSGLQGSGVMNSNTAGKEALHVERPVFNREDAGSHVPAEGNEPHPTPSPTPDSQAEGPSDGVLAVRLEDIFYYARRMKLLKSHEYKTLEQSIAALRSRPQSGEDEKGAK